MSGAPVTGAPAVAAASPAPCPATCTRATLLRSAAALAMGGAGAAVLVGCADPDAPSGVAAPPSGGGDKVTVAASDVPVGGVVSQTVGEDPVVVAQPSEGEFVAYSAVCTHAGGIVAPAGKLVVQCPLHGSEFDLGDDGAVLAPPAKRPLAEYPLTVAGDQLELG